MRPMLTCTSVVVSAGPPWLGRWDRGGNAALADQRTRIAGASSGSTWRQAGGSEFDGGVDEVVSGFGVAGVLVAGLAFRTARV